MADSEWVIVREISGELIAEAIRGLLESQGIQVFLNQEGAGKAYGLNVGPLGITQILVPSEQVEKAQVILNDYDHGLFENTDWPPSSVDPDQG
jgi:hypothetical protein